MKTNIAKQHADLFRAFRGSIAVFRTFKSTSLIPNLNPVKILNFSRK